MNNVESGYLLLIKKSIEGLHAAISHLCDYLEHNQHISTTPVDDRLLKARMELDKITNEVFNSK